MYPIVTAVNTALGYRVVKRVTPELLSRKEKKKEPYVTLRLSFC